MKNVFRDVKERNCHELKKIWEIWGRGKFHDLKIDFFFARINFSKCYSGEKLQEHHAVKNAKQLNKVRHTLIVLDESCNNLKASGTIVFPLLLKDVEISFFCI